MKSILFPLYSVVVFGTWFNCCNGVSDNGQYSVESRIHGEHFETNVTCLRDGGNHNNSGAIKRALSLYGTYNHKVSPSKLNVVEDVVKHNDPRGEDLTKNKIENSLIKEKEKDIIKSKNDENLYANAETGTDWEVEPSTHGVILVDCDLLEINPDFLNSSIHRLKIKSTGTLKLTPDWAKKSPRLTTLKIRADKGVILPPNCSWVPESTNSLNLAYTPLNNFTLSGCPASLKKLQLQGTILQDISICVASLEELDLSWNMISEQRMSLNCFQMTDNLKQLKIHNNELTSWNSCNWTELTFLELQNNNIETIDFSSCPPHNLLHLNLAHNKLTIPPLVYPSKLAFISLSHNHLTELSRFNRGQQVSLIYFC